MFIKIQNEILPCLACYTTGTGEDWGFRNAYLITIPDFNYDDAVRLFYDGAEWGTVMTENGDGYNDHSDYCVAGNMTVHRNGRIDILMGQKTQSEKMEDENQRVLPLIQASLPLLDDKTALEYVSYFRGFEELVEERATEQLGYRFKYNNLLYKLMQPSYTFDGVYVPGEPGTESLFARVTLEEEGTHDNPIVYDGNMELFNGKYYTQDDVLYLCFRDTGVPVYNALADLVGIYVEVSE